MTETEWLACEGPRRMLAFLAGKTGERKLRLFACGCCRRVWHLLKDDRSRQAVEAAERFAEGAATSQELRVAAGRAYLAGSELRYGPKQGTEAEADAAEAASTVASYEGDASSAAVFSALRAAVAVSGDGPADPESGRQCSLIREVVGPAPFRPVNLDPVWLTSNVLALARTADEERELPSGLLERTRLAILADALMDAGCDDAEILGHCRNEGPHYRGCWVVDLILGKQ